MKNTTETVKEKRKKKIPKKFKKFTNVFSQPVKPPMSSNCNFQWFFESLEVRKGKKKKQQKKTVKIDQQKRNQSQKKKEKRKAQARTHKLQVTGKQKKVARWRNMP